MAQNEGNNLASAEGQRARLIAIVKPMPRTTECDDESWLMDFPTTSTPLNSQVETDNPELNPEEDTETGFNPPCLSECVELRELILGQIWTYARLSIDATRFIGCKISLTSRSNLRYEGPCKIQLDAVSISIAEVRAFGTEDRVTSRPVLPSYRIRKVLTFCFTRVQDVHVLELPETQNVPHRVQTTQRMIFIGAKFGSQAVKIYTVSVCPRTLESGKSNFLLSPSEQSDAFDYDQLDDKLRIKRATAGSSNIELGSSIALLISVSTTTSRTSNSPLLLKSQLDQLSNPFLFAALAATTLAGAFGSTSIQNSEASKVNDVLSATQHKFRSSHSSSPFDPNFQSGEIVDSSSVKRELHDKFPAVTSKKLTNDHTTSKPDDTGYYLNYLPVSGTVVAAKSWRRSDVVASTKKMLPLDQSLQLNPNSLVVDRPQPVYVRY
ncbi:Protein LSM14 B [Orchesella cincta]|uniref:Protein LSM14 B n=1 Tax=Orchesella cincta TaxID=48709 RepID=A0A1D2M9P9_ORCCI|nr:Protein LSM14 B [Orchesella cincta]